MDEKNPLHVCSFPSHVSSDRILNKSGRPNMKTIVKFSQQPKSIIAQMLSEMKAKNKKDDEEIVCQSDETCDIVETDKTEELVCKACSYRSASSKEHKKHTSSHQQFSCDYPNCSYSCKLSSNLIKHKRVHTNEKPYLCDRCSFRSNFVNSLKAHRRIHTAEKPYQCEYCSYRCNSSSNLKKHCHLRHFGAPNAKYKTMC